MASIPDGLRESLWIVAAMRVSLSIVGAYVASEHVFPHPCHFEEARAGWSSLPYQWKDGAGFKLVGVWERWDACWYVKLATFGYRRDDGGDGGFFPVYPALVRAVGILMDPAIAGLVVSAMALVLALWGIHRLVAPALGERVARRAMLFVAIFPGAIFLLAPFSEATFLALSAWALDAARRGRWPLATVLALLAGATRPVGALLAVPLAWTALRSWLRAGHRLSDLGALAAPLGPPAGFAAFAMWAQAVTGEGPIEQARRMGSTSFHPPWEALAASVRWTGERGDPLQALNLALLVLFGVLVILGIRRLPPDLTLYAAPLVAVLAMRINPIPLSGTTRYLAVAFPALVVLAILAERPSVRWAWAILSLLFLALLAHTFVRGDFVA